MLPKNACARLIYSSMLNSTRLSNRKARFFFRGRLTAFCFRQPAVTGLLAAGKRPKVAIVACMRKLLGAIYSVARNRRPFVPRLATAGHEQPMTAG